MQDYSLLIKISPKEFLISDTFMRHIVKRLEYGQKFKEKLVVVDGENQNINNTKSKSDFAFIKKQIR